ncbi:MAG: HAD family phosphatase, partial [Bdellovibrionota bacterium]
MPKAQVVIALDMDGVLISTAGALYRIFDEFTAKYGGRATTELFEFYNGKKIVEVVRDLSVRFKYTQSEEHLLADYFSRIEEIYKTCELQAGALEFLKYCRQSNIPVCLATGANRSVAETVLESTKTSSYFDFTVCADDVQNGKPSPEMYLKIKDRFPADLYIAVDDADNGIQGARAAGMKAYLFG